MINWQNTDPNVTSLNQSYVSNANDIDIFLLSALDVLDKELISRIKYVAKALLFGVAAVLQFGKVTIRFLALPLTTIIQIAAAATKTDIGEDISYFLEKHSGLKVIAIDTILTISLIGKTIFSLICAAYNPEKLPDIKPLVQNENPPKNATEKNFLGKRISITDQEPDSFEECLKKIKNILDDTSLAKGEKINRIRKNPGGVLGAMDRIAKTFSSRLSFLKDFLFGAILGSTSI